LFTTITEYSEVTIRSGSIIIRLPVPLNIIHILGVQPSNVTVANFIFYQSTNTNTSDSNNKTELTIEYCLPLVCMLSVVVT